MGPPSLPVIILPSPAPIPSPRKLFTRVTCIALALFIQLSLLATLSYSPDALSHIVKTHIWRARPPFDADVIRTDTTGKEDASFRLSIASDQLKAGKKKTLPTHFRERPWTNSRESLIDGLCGADVLLTVHDLSILSQNGDKAALVFPTLSPTTSPEVAIPVTSEPLCGWLVVVDWGDSMAAAPWYNVSDPMDPPPVLEGWPPDSADIRAEGVDFTHAVEVGREWVVLKGRKSEVGYRVYNITAHLRDPDVFELQGVLEYSDYLWNYEEPRQVFWDPTPLPIYLTTPSLTLVPSLLLSTEDTVTRLTSKTYESLPYCRNGNHPGRWVPETYLSPLSALKMQDPENTTSPALLSSYSNRTWVPYACRYDVHGYSEWKSTCLTPRHPYLHLFGDSNIRRGVKALSSEGAWCTKFHDEWSSQCQCADWHIGVEGIAPDRADNLLHVGANATEVLYVYLWKGLLDWGGWKDGVDATRQAEELPKWDASLSTRKPTAVVVSLTNWDAGYGSLSHFKESLPVLASLLAETYPATPLIIRSGQHYAARADTTAPPVTRRFSRMRVMAFNELAEQGLMYHPAGVGLWDVHQLGEAMDKAGRERGKECASGHAGRDVVDWENNLLLNMLCPGK
ncbi:hypothetical protein HKX48_007794 [Thoreauomyces humboldtii]|nr:hypothetical protein HKX48_007794 [Thoreauomyces humboldtii]